MDYYNKYQGIIADYNREKDRATVEQTFADLLDLASKLDAARIATASGGVAVIANGRTPGVLDRLFAGEAVGTVFCPRAGTRDR